MKRKSRPLLFNVGWNAPGTMTKVETKMKKKESDEAESFVVHLKTNNAPVVSDKKHYKKEPKDN